MSHDDPITRVVALLTDSGYQELDQPTIVGGIPFDFAAMLIKESSLDLIAIVDTVMESDDARLRGTVEGLKPHSRAPVPSPIPRSRSGAS
jgi:hypothetical protein